MTVFARDTEQDAYCLLHVAGFEAFRNCYGTATASDLINRWAKRRIVRVTHPNGGFVVRTFKKYAELKEPR